MELFTKLFGSLLVFVYHCFDRIVIHGYSERVVAARAGRLLLPPGGGRAGGRQGGAEPAHRRLSGLGGGLCPQPRHSRSSGPRKACARKITSSAGCARWSGGTATGCTSSSRAWSKGRPSGARVPKYPTQDPNHRILAPQRSRFTHYYFYIRDEVLGPMVMRVASFFPFQTTYYLNGHSFIERELKRAEIGFRKNDNAFLAVDDVAALQAAADRLSPELIRERLDYWTLLLGPKFSAKERKQMNLRRFYAIAQIEYCRNFIFKRHFPIHKIFERSCELGLWRLTAHKISEIFGSRLTKQAQGQAQHHPRTGRARPSYLPRLLEARLRQAVREILHLPAQRGLLESLADFGLRKGLDHLAAVREKFLDITERFAAFQRVFFKGVGAAKRRQKFRTRHGLMFLFHIALEIQASFGLSPRS